MTREGVEATERFLKKRTPENSEPSSLSHRVRRSKIDVADLL